jgi:8-oxo-dGTP diphosphatase
MMHVADRADALLLVAACALVDADHRVLLTRRPEGQPIAGLWEFPAASCCGERTNRSVP